jgi:opacity protein-like surface antigen
MRKESLFMRKRAGISIALFLFASLASAQIPASGNIFVGYSYENASSSVMNLNLSRPNLQGWEASLEGKVAPWIGIVTDFSGHYGSQTFVELPGGPGPVTIKVTGHELEVMFGPRVSVPIGKYTPFGEAMVGIAHINTGGTFPGPSNTSLATALGGGIDYRLVKLVALRLEGNYITTRFFNTTQNNIRLSTGVVLRF